MSDGGPEGEVQRPLRLGSLEAGFLVSLRHGLLPLRLGGLVVLEPYMPHRCAHQFGLDSVFHPTSHHLEIPALT